jgi:hypothetical protein
MTDEVLLVVLMAMGNGNDILAQRIYEWERFE